MLLDEGDVSKRSVAPVVQDVQDGLAKLKDLRAGGIDYRLQGAQLVQTVLSGCGRVTECACVVIWRQPCQPNGCYRTLEGVEREAALLLVLSDLGLDLGYRLERLSVVLRPKI